MRKRESTFNSKFPPMATFNPTSYSSSGIFTADFWRVFVFSITKSNSTPYHVLDRPIVI